jgi:hypothetical protein
MAQHCCDTMKYWANYVCEKHPNPFDCPDNLVTYDAADRSYGLIVHDGGSSSISIQFCPWCGANITATASTHEL